MDSKRDLITNRDKVWCISQIEVLSIGYTLMT